jgi:hypothetical protein
VTAHRILGWVEEVTTCDCCGKSKLSGTFACDLEGDVIHYGSTCVTRNTGVKNPRTAASVYLRERQAQAGEELRQTPEFAAYRARLAEAQARNLFGRECADFVRETGRAESARAAEIAAKWRLDYLYA